MSVDQGGAGPQTEPTTARAGLPADEVLVAALRAGDAAVFAQLLDAWSRGMLALARECGCGTDGAQDVVQETWLAVIRSVERFEGRSSLRTWVYRILVNNARAWAARNSRAVPWSEAFPEDESGPTVSPVRFQLPDRPYPGHWRKFPQPWPSPESDVLAGEMRRQVGAALAALPPRQRSVISLRDVEGYSSPEVCEILEISAANQRVLLHRARAAVRARLEQYFEHPAKEA